jgi:hypothetical protein
METINGVDRKKGFSPSVFNLDIVFPSSSTNLQSVLVDPLSAINNIISKVQKLFQKHLSFLIIPVPYKYCPSVSGVHPGK